MNKEIIIQVLHKGVFQKAIVSLDNPNSKNARWHSVWPSIEDAKYSLAIGYILELADGKYIEIEKARIKFIDRNELYMVPPTTIEEHPSAVASMKSMGYDLPVYKGADIVVDSYGTDLYDQLANNQKLLGFNLIVDQNLNLKSLKSSGVLAVEPTLTAWEIEQMKQKENQ